MRHLATTTGAPHLPFRGDLYFPCLSMEAFQGCRACCLETWPRPGVSVSRAPGHRRISIASRRTANSTDVAAPMMLPTRYSWLRRINSVTEVATNPALIVSHTHARRRRQNASTEAGKTVRPFTTDAQASRVWSVAPRVMKGTVINGMIPHIIPTAKRHRSQNCRRRVSSIIAP